VFLGGHFVAMETHCVTKMITAWSPMTGQFVDTMIVASSDKEWLIMIHQNLTAGNYFEPTSNWTKLSKKLRRKTPRKQLSGE